VRKKKKKKVGYPREMKKKGGEKERNTDKQWGKCGREFEGRTGETGSGGPKPRRKTG